MKLANLIFTDDKKRRWVHDNEGPLIFWSLMALTITVASLVAIYA